MSLLSSLFRPVRRSPFAGLVASGSVLLVTWGAGCSTYEDRIGYVEPPKTEPPQLSPSTPDASTTDAAGEGLLCAATDCPAPYATCERSRYRCDINLDSDNENCGGCGIRCIGSEGSDVEGELHADWRCSSGACQMSCLPGWTDCNGSPGDGCEVNTRCDTANCGGCGIACAAGQDCILGKCGCPQGLTQCTPAMCSVADLGACRDVQNDDTACGACGVECPPVEDTPPHTYVGCAEGECKALKCEGPWEDCNKKIEVDGCEVNIHEDPNNCGACGFQCAPGQRCWDGQCLCAPGAQLCESGEGIFYQAACYYIDVDPNNCGACGRRCPGGNDGASAACRDGQCILECAPGRADCDADPQNGCETRVDSDPNNCGGCGVQCDVAAGQPCIRGQCALAPCPEQPVQ